MFVGLLWLFFFRFLLGRFRFQSQWVNQVNGVIKAVSIQFHISGSVAQRIGLDEMTKIGVVVPMEEMDKSGFPVQ